MTTVADEAGRGRGFVGLRRASALELRQFVVSASPGSAWRSRSAALTRSRTSCSKNWPVVTRASRWKSAICWRVRPTSESPHAEGVVEEGEGVVLRQRGEPERELREVHGHRVLVHAVEAALGDEAAGVETRPRRAGSAAPVVDVPGLDQLVAELAAGLDQERAGAHRRVADLQIEDLLGRRASRRVARRIGSSVVATIGSVSERGV